MAGADEHRFVTTREFDNALRALQIAMADGFGGIHDRLDKLNSKTDKNITSIEDLRIAGASHAAKIATLNREVFDRPARQKPVDEDGKPITRRDLNVAIAVAVAAIGVVVWLFMTFGPNVYRSGA